VVDSKRLKLNATDVVLPSSLIVIAEEEVNSDVMADDAKKKDMLVKPVTSEATNALEANPAAGDANAPSTEQPTTSPTTALTHA
jgi:hypothetical protein